MTLRSVDGRLITKVARESDFNDVLRHLGPARADEVRKAIVHAVDNIPPDAKTGKRTFNSTPLGASLAPWPYPLTHIEDVAKAIQGPSATAEDIEERSSWIFGLFVWEHIMRRKEDWRFYDPNLGKNDPNREPIGKTYFEE